MIDGIFARFGAWRTRGVRGDDVKILCVALLSLVERLGYYL